MRTLRALAAGVGLSLAVGGLTIACSPAAPTTPTPTAADPFAVVRATSQAAYRSGKELLDRGDLRGCSFIDTAKTNDPDNSQEIQQALERCLEAIAQFQPTPEPTSATQRPIVVATLAAVTPQAAPPAVAPPTPVLLAQPTAVAVGKPTDTAPGKPNGAVSGTPTAAAVAKPTAPAAAKPTSAAPGPATPQATTAPVGLVPWRDPQGRFSVSSPPEWQRAEPPQSMFGMVAPVFQVHDPSGQAELDVAVDTSSRVVSPELYAAGMEITMQQQVAGYAAEQVLPGSTAGNPSIRRVFTFTERDASGRDIQARGFQITVLKGSTPYIITGSAPAEQFQQYRTAFDQMVESFRFS